MTVMCKWIIKLSSDGRRSCNSVNDIVVVVVVDGAINENEFIANIKSV